MKKGFALFCAVLMLSLSLCGCQQPSDPASTPVSTTATTTTTAPSTTTTTASTTTATTAATTVAGSVPAGETLAQKLTREMEEAYERDSLLPEYSSTIGMIELADKYTAEWKKIADEYYDKILQYDGIEPMNDQAYNSEDLHAFVKAMKANWEQYSEQQADQYAKVQLAIYQGGTIVGPICAGYRYELQKNWALELVEIYEQL